MIMDKKLLQKIKDIESFTEEEKTKIYDLIDMAISYNKTKKVFHKKKPQLNAVVLNLKNIY